MLTLDEWEGRVGDAVRRLRIEAGYDQAGLAERAVPATNDRWGRSTGTCDAIFTAASRARIASVLEFGLAKA